MAMRGWPGGKSFRSRRKRNRRIDRRGAYLVRYEVRRFWGTSKREGRRSGNSERGAGAVRQLGVGKGGRAERDAGEVNFSRARRSWRVSCLRDNRPCVFVSSLFRRSGLSEGQSVKRQRILGVELGPPNRRSDSEVRNSVKNGPKKYVTADEAQISIYSNFCQKILESISKVRGRRDESNAVSPISFRQPIPKLSSLKDPMLPPAPPCLPR